MDKERELRPDIMSTLDKQCGRRRSTHLVHPGQLRKGFVWITKSPGSQMFLVNQDKFEFWGET